MYWNTDEIEKLKRIKEDSDREAVTATMQLKDLSESQDSMQQELVELRQVRDAAQEIAEVMDIQEGDEDEPLTLAGNLRKIPESFERCSPQPPVSTWDMYSGWWNFTGHQLHLMHSERAQSLIVPMISSVNIC